MKHTREKSREINLSKIRHFLSLPENLGQIIPYNKLRKKGMISDNWLIVNFSEFDLAQEWMSVNIGTEACPAKTYYLTVLNDQTSKLFPKIDLKVGKKEFSITHEKIAEKIRKSETVAGRLAQKISKFKTTTTVTDLVPTNERQFNLKRLKDAFVLAPLGDKPRITKLLSELKLDLPEEEVRVTMMTEDWKGQREEFLYRTFDLVKVEADMLSHVQALEMQDILFKEMKTVHRNNQQYYVRGYVKSLDGTTNLDLKPDPGSLALLAETARRIVGPSYGAGNINIQVNNQYSSKSASQYDAFRKEYINNLNNLTPDQIQSEIDRLKATVDMVVKRGDDKLTQEVIEAQIEE